MGRLLQQLDSNMRPNVPYSTRQEDVLGHVGRIIDQQLRQLQNCQPTQQKTPLIPFKPTDLMIGVVLAVAQVENSSYQEFGSIMPTQRHNITSFMDHHQLSLIINILIRFDIQNRKTIKVFGSTLVLIYLKLKQWQTMAMIPAFICLLLCLYPASSRQPTNNDLSITYVTALWNTKRGAMGLGSRSFDYYLRNFALLLQTEQPFIIYGDEELESFVWERRKPYNTQFIRKSLEEIKQYWYTKKIWEVIDEVKQDPLKYRRYSILPQYKLKMYNPVVMSKLRLIRQSKLLDKFKSDYYIWLDAGFPHSLGTDFLNKNTFINYVRTYQIDWFFHAGQDLPFKPFEVGISNLSRYMVEGPEPMRYVWGNWLGGKASAIETVYHIYENFLRLMLENRDMNIDETVFIFMLKRYPYMTTASESPDYFLFKNYNITFPIRNNTGQRVITLSEIKTKASSLIHHSPIELENNQPLVVRKTERVRNWHLLDKLILEEQSILNTRMIMLTVTALCTLVARIVIDKSVGKSKSQQPPQAPQSP